MEVRFCVFQKIAEMRGRKRGTRFWKEGDDDGKAWHGWKVVNKVNELVRRREKDRDRERV